MTSTFVKAALAVLLLPPRWAFKCSGTRVRVVEIGKPVATARSTSSLREAGTRRHVARSSRLRGAQRPISLFGFLFRHGAQRQIDERRESCRGRTSPTSIV